MARNFSSTPASLWDRVATDYEEHSFHRKNKLYPANKFRYEIVLDFLKKQSKGAILDAGCGPGLMTRLLQKEGWDVTACDYSQGMLTTARKKAMEENLPDVYHQLALNQLSKLGGEFDIVIINGVLPYIAAEQEPKVFAEIKKVLKPKGVLIASHYNLFFDIFGLDRYSLEALTNDVLEQVGLPQPELQKAQTKIRSLLKNPERVLDQERTMKSENPLTYKNKLAKFGFVEFDQAYYNLFYLPGKFEADQDQTVREQLERKLCHDPNGLLLYRTFVSFAKLTS